MLFSNYDSIAISNSKYYKALTLLFKKVYFETE